MGERQRNDAWLGLGAAPGTHGQDSEQTTVWREVRKTKQSSASEGRQFSDMNRA